MIFHLDIQVRGDMVCKLNKFLYGLRKASRQWYHMFSTIIMQNGFQQSSTYHSLFIKGIGSSTIILVVYVDDVVLTSYLLVLLKKTQEFTSKHV